MQLFHNLLLPSNASWPNFSEMLRWRTFQHRNILEVSISFTWKLLLLTQLRKCHENLSQLIWAYNKFFFSFVTFHWLCESNLSKLGRKNLCTINVQIQSYSCGFCAAFSVYEILFKITNNWKCMTITKHFSMIHLLKLLHFPLLNTEFARNLVL